MPRLFSPSTAIGAALAVAALACTYAASQHAANLACHVDQQAAALRRANQVTKLSEQHRHAEAQLREQLAAQLTTAQETHARLQAERDAFAARLRSGASRVSIPAARCIANSGAGPAAAAGDLPARAELAPETAQALDRIASDGDDAIGELNRCIAAYEAARAIVNATP